jgi:hypothetical protein
MPGPKILTEVGIRSMISAARKTGREQWVSDGLIPRTHGGLQLRVKPAACFWYFRYTDAQGKKQRIPPGILIPILRSRRAEVSSSLFSATV